MATRKLTTFEAFHRLVPSICRRMHEDPALAVRAMANPILAMEELGIELEPAVAREVERRLRFSEAERKKLAELEGKLIEIGGTELNPESNEHIEKLLFSTLKIERPAGLGSLDIPRHKPLKPIRTSVRRDKSAPERPEGKPTKRLEMRLEEQARPVDPLRVLAGAHPAVDLLLEYRAVLSSKPKLGTRQEYEIVKANPQAFPIRNIKLHLPEHVGPTEDDHA